MPWTEKCKLISKDPGTCSRYFNNRVQKFFKHILKSPYSPFGILINCKVIRVRYAYNHIQVRPVYNK